MCVLLRMLSTSVIAWIEAPYFTSSSMTLMRFFLQAMCSGVKPFCAKDNHVSSSMHPQFSRSVRLSDFYCSDNTLRRIEKASKLEADSSQWRSAQTECMMLRKLKICPKSYLTCRACFTLSPLHLYYPM